jgi:ornithine carbamoyltransferase
MNHLLSLTDLTSEELIGVLDAADRLKHTRLWHGTAKPLDGRSVAMIFSKSSTRTRVSFEVGIYELGGNGMYFDKNALQLGRGEPISDTAKVLSRYVHGIVIRYHEHEDVVELAKHSSVPVVNALTDRFHPCQLLADLMTIREVSGQLEGIRVAYLGDGASNMAHSWALAAKLSGVDLVVGAPTGYQPDPKVLNSVAGPGSVTVTDDPVAAAKDADFIYTDVWVSMGFEEESAQRLEDMQPYQVNMDLLGHAKPDVKFMHCLPAYRGKEVTCEVLDCKSSIIYDQAENRLHAQKAVLAQLFNV